MIAIDKKVWSLSMEGLNKSVGLTAVLPERDRE